MQRITKIPRLPDRPNDGNKGTFGKILIVGGSDEMIGAPVLAGTAALRMGGGLVQIAVPREILAAAISITPELIGLALDRDDKKLLAAAEKADAIVVGPGLGSSPASKKRVEKLIRLNKPMVLDADALNHLAAAKSWPKNFKASAVLTPHPGEMKRLAKLFGESEIPTDDAGWIDVAIRASKAFKQIVVLKGHRTVVTDGKKVFVNRTGDSSLAKAGTGDVLSGMLGTLLAQKMDRFDAACLAVHLHGLAGELAGKEIGQRSVLARDVIDAIPRVLKNF